MGDLRDLGEKDVLVLMQEEKVTNKITKEIVDLALLIRNKGISVVVSGLVPRYDYLEPKRVKVNYVLRDLCAENNLPYTDHSNINPSNT